MLDLPMVDRDVALVRDLLEAPAKGHIVEFKHNNIDAKVISALSNSARKDNKPSAYIVWGVEDGTHEPIGTTLDPEVAKMGNQPLQIWLSNQLRPKVDFGFRRVDYEGNSPVLLEVPPALNAPVEFEGTACIRVGEATPRLFGQCASPGGIVARDQFIHLGNECGQEICDG